MLVPAAKLLNVNPKNAVRIKNHFLKNGKSTCKQRIMIELYLVKSRHFVRPFATIQQEQNRHAHGEAVGDLFQDQ